MGALPDLSEVYDGSIAGVDMDHGAWLWGNPRVLIGPSDKRGSGLEVPRGDGEVPMPQRLMAHEESLNIVFIGDVDRDGVPADNPQSQLIRNLRWFEQNVYLATPDADHCVAIDVVDPGGVEWMGRCQMRSFRWGDSDSAEGLTTCRATLRVYLPQRLEEVTSS